MYELVLNLIPQGVLPRLNVSQYDHGQTVDVTLYEGSTAYTLPNGATVTVSGTKADNTGFEYNCTTTGGLSFTIADQMTVFAGEVECELTIRYGNNRISTINFILDVERAALQDDVVISETDLPILQQIPEYAAQASADADRAEQAAATAMSTDAGKVTDRLNLNNCRNLVVPADINFTRNGVTMRTNADGSITLSGQSTSSSAFILWYSIFDSSTTYAPQKWLPNGKYTLYGDSVGGRIVSGGTRIASMQVYGIDAGGSEVTLAENGNGQDKNFTVTDGVKSIRVRIYVIANADFGTGMTIYPMITTQSTENVTGYEQGALSNRALTIKEQELDATKVSNIVEAQVVDLNDVETGMVYATSSSANLPSSQAYAVLTMGSKAETGSRGRSQFAIALTSESIAYFRRRSNAGEWGVWNRLQLYSDDSLQTTTKTIVGAINELKARIDAL